MNPRHKASAAAIELIKRFEGYRPTAAELSDGRWTIGYGHTKTAREGAEVSESDAEMLLLYDLTEVQAAVNSAVYTPLTQNQYDALTAFAFNIGVENFRRSSALRRLNEGNLVQAACAIEMWRKADLDGERIVVDALVRRRAAEKALFLTPTSGWVPAPSPIVRPRVDYDVGLSLPRSSSEVTVSMTGPIGEAHKAGGGATASTAIAAAMAARLQAIAANPTTFAEAEAGIDLTPPPPPPLEDLAPEPVALAPAPVVEAPVAESPGQDDMTFTLTAPPEPLPREPSRQETAPVIEEAAPPQSLGPSSPLFEDAAPFDIPSHIATDASRRIVRREAPVEIDSSPFITEAPRFGGLHLLVLALAGLAVFAGSVFWGVNAKGAGGVLNPMLVAGILGVVGIICVAGAVYFLLVRLGGRED